MIDKLKRWEASHSYDTSFESMKWVNEIPFLRFPANWYVQIIPPFASAVSRFRVSKDTKFDKCVSIYLDCYSMLGTCDTPYWEVYPYNGDVYRCPMNNTDDLIKAIKHSLKKL